MKSLSSFKYHTIVSFNNETTLNPYKKEELADGNQRT